VLLVWKKKKLCLKKGFSNRLDPKKVPFPMVAVVGVDWHVPGIPLHDPEFTTANCRVSPAQMVSLCGRTSTGGGTFCNTTFMVSVTVLEVGMSVIVTT